jgi:hypothetical protein
MRLIRPETEISSRAIASVKRAARIEQVRAGFSAPLRPLIVLVAGTGMAAFLLLPLVAAALALVFAPINVSAWVALGAVGFVALIGYFMSSSLQWVELDGGMIRARRPLTWKLVEQRVADIVDAKPLHSQAMGPLENAAMDALLKTTNRGYEIRFKDGTRLGLVRGEMAGLDAFLGALAAELVRRREGDRGG